MIRDRAASTASCAALFLFSLAAISSCCLFRCVIARKFTAIRLLYRHTFSAGNIRSATRSAQQRPTKKALHTNRLTQNYIQQPTNRRTVKFKQMTTAKIPNAQNSAEAHNQQVETKTSLVCEQNGS